MKSMQLKEQEGAPHQLKADNKIEEDKAEGHVDGDATPKPQLELCWSSTCTCDIRKLWLVYSHLLDSLFEKVNEGGTVGLNSQLLNTYIEAGMNCPGFAMWVKDDIVIEVGGTLASYGVSSLAKFWPFDCLAMPAGVRDQEAHNWLKLLASGARDKLDKVQGRV